MFVGTHPPHCAPRFVPAIVSSGCWSRQERFPRGGQMDRIDAMKVFVTAVDEGSLAGAARRLKRSPTAVSPP